MPPETARVIHSYQFDDFNKPNALCQKAKALALPPDNGHREFQPRRSCSPWH